MWTNFASGCAAFVARCSRFAGTAIGDRPTARWCAGRKDIGGLGEGRGSATSAARRGGWIIAIGSGPTVHAGGEA
jgi:hypothetical protein